MGRSGLSNEKAAVYGVPAVRKRWARRLRSALRATIVLGLAWLPTVAAATDAQSPREFLKEAYASYVDGSTARNALGQDAESLFAPALLALIREDQRTAHGEVGLLDHDPICACQDFERLRVVSIHITSLAKSSAHARVRIMNGGHQVRIDFALILGADGWRIQDIDEPGIGSLMRYLQRGLAASRGKASH